jgi:hypothetical protein
VKWLRTSVRSPTDDSRGLLIRACFATFAHGLRTKGAGAHRTPRRLLTPAGSGSETRCCTSALTCYLGSELTKLCLTGYRRSVRTVVVRAAPYRVPASLTLSRAAGGGSAAAARPFAFAALVRCLVAAEFLLRAFAAVEQQLVLGAVVDPVSLPPLVCL